MFIISKHQAAVMKTAAGFISRDKNRVYVIRSNSMSTLWTCVTSHGWKDYFKKTSALHIQPEMSLEVFMTKAAVFSESVILPLCLH